jgi:hypothetical protein
MTSLDMAIIRTALDTTGQFLTSDREQGSVRVVIAGGVAGLLGGLLPPTRVTADCDVMWLEDTGQWARLERAVALAADALGLPATWLNRHCAMYAWCLPLGWLERCEDVGRFGPLEVWRLGRADLIASKVMGAPIRPQDFDDLGVMSPTNSELNAVLHNLDRLEAEDLNGTSFDRQRAIIIALRTQS